MAPCRTPWLHCHLSGELAAYRPLYGLRQEAREARAAMARVLRGQTAGGRSGGGRRDPHSARRPPWRCPRSCVRSSRRAAPIPGPGGPPPAGRPGGCARSTRVTDRKRLASVAVADALCSNIFRADLCSLGNNAARFADRKSMLADGHSARQYHGSRAGIRWQRRLSPVPPRETAPRGPRRVALRRNC